MPRKMQISMTVLYLLVIAQPLNAMLTQQRQAKYSFKYRSSLFIGASLIGEVLLSSSIATKIAILHKMQNFKDMAHIESTSCVSPSLCEAFQIMRQDLSPTKLSTSVVLDGAAIILNLWQTYPSIYRRKNFWGTALGAWGLGIAGAALTLSTDTDFIAMYSYAFKHGGHYRENVPDDQWYALRSLYESTAWPIILEWSALALPIVQLFYLNS